MGIGAEDGGANDSACAVCTRLRRSTHGKGMSFVVPRFLKAVLDYSTPGSKNCYMQIPAGYVREHIGKGSKDNYILEGVTGSEWTMHFNNSALCGGWKMFAIDYHLEKGDQIMFGLVAPRRFYVNVFDKFGTEKFGTRDSLTGHSDGTNHRERSGEEKPNERISPSEATSAQVLKSNGLGINTTPVKTSGQNEHHDRVLAGGISGFKSLYELPPEDTSSPQSGPCTLNRAQPEFDPARALIAKHSTREPVKFHDAEPSAMSDSPAESDDSVEVLLAKAVLAKAKQKRLKKRKLSCTTNQAEMVTEAIGSEGTHRTRERVVNLKMKNGDWTNKSLSRLNADSLTASLRGDDAAAARDETEFEEAVYGKSREDPRVWVDGSNGQTESQICSIQAQTHQDRRDGVEVTNFEERKEPKDTRNGVSDQFGGVFHESPQLDHRQTEAMAMGQTDAAGGETGQDAVGKRAGELQSELERSNPHSPVFHAALVKQEFELANGLGPAMPFAGARPLHHNEKCANCGLATMPGQDHSSPPPVNRISEEAGKGTSDGPESIETRSPRSHAPSSTPGGRVTEDQKQRALEAAKIFSANTKNPSAVIVMRISFVEKTCACFVSVKCAEMFPRVPTEVLLIDNEGCVRKASWKPERRYLLGPGWKDFVDAKNLQVHDVCVMEVIDKCQLQVKVVIHIFHAHEMETGTDKQTGKEKAPEQLIPGAAAGASSGARTRSEEKRAPPPSSLHELLPPRRKKRRKRIPIDQVVEKEHRRPTTGLTMPSPQEKATEPSKEKATEPSKVKAPEPSKRKATEPSKEKATEPSKEQQDGQLSPESISSPTFIPAREQVRKKEKRYTTGMHAPLLLASKKIAPADSRISKNKKDRPEKEKHESLRPVRGDKWHPRKQYPVAKLVDRRKSLHGVVFLVELKEAVVQGSGQKKLKAKQDEKGRWWVPHNHFTSDFSSCYIE